MYNIRYVCSTQKLFLWNSLLLYPQERVLRAKFLLSHPNSFEQKWLYHGEHITLNLQAELSPSEFSPEDLELREFSPGQLNNTLRLYDLGQRKSFLAICMGMWKKSLCRKRKNGAVTLGSKINWLSFTERWRIQFPVFHSQFPITRPFWWGWILWIIHWIHLISPLSLSPWICHFKASPSPKDPCIRNTTYYIWLFLAFNP